MNQRESGIFILCKEFQYDLCRIYLKSNQQCVLFYHLSLPLKYNHKFMMLHLIIINLCLYKYRQTLMTKAFDIGELRRTARIKQNDPMRSYSQIHKSPLKSFGESYSGGQSYYLSRWGRNLEGKIEKSVPWVNVGQGIYSVGIGEEHVLIINNKNQCFAYGGNTYGQLAQDQDNVTKPMLISAFKDMKIVSIACGAYHSFVQNSKGEIFSFGLNLKGQLGIGSFKNKKKPTLVYSLLPGGIKNPKANFFIETNQYKKKVRRGKSQISELSSISNLIEKLDEDTYTNDDFPEFLLGSDESVVKIVCGPLHSAVVTNKNRLFVCGYGDKYGLGTGDQKTIYDFEEVRLKTNGARIQKIQAGFSSLGVIIGGRVQVCGKIGDKSYQNFTSLHLNDQAIDLKLTEKSILILTKKGDLYQCGQLFKENLEKITTQVPRRIENVPKFKTIFNGVGNFFGITENGQFYGWGDNRDSQVSGIKDDEIIWIPKCLKIPIHESAMIISGNGTTFMLSCKPLQTQFSKFKTELSSIKDQNPQISSQQRKKYLKGSSNLCGTQEKNMLSQLGVQPRTFHCNMEINFNQIVFENQISEGGYGIIYKGTWRETTVAIKMFKVQSDGAIKDFFSECAAMEALRHPNIVMFLGACTKSPNFAIVLEYCARGSLWSTLQNLDVQLSWQDRRRFALDTAKGVHYLHTCNPPIIHRDLKSLNLLLDDSYRVKLADFGWTKGLDNFMTGKIGTYQWMAPEVIASQKYSEKADVFSYGIILWEIASREPPFKNLNGLQVSIEVLNNDMRPIIPKKTPQSFVKLMRRCWDRDPSKRPSFRQIIKDLQTMKL